MRVLEAERLLRQSEARYNAIFKTAPVSFWVNDFSEVKAELDALAQRCTDEEDAATKVERQVGKSAAALLLESRVGEKFDAIVTGASEKGTWVRLLTVPVEGRLSIGFEGVDVGNRLRVQLISTDVERGFIDFKKVGEAGR